MSRAIADTSVFLAGEADRPLGDLPDEIAVSVITAADAYCCFDRRQSEEKRERVGRLSLVWQTAGSA